MAWVFGFLFVNAIILWFMALHRIRVMEDEKVEWLNERRELYRHRDDDAETIFGLRAALEELGQDNQPASSVSRKVFPEYLAMKDD